MSFTHSISHVASIGETSSIASQHVAIIGAGTMGRAIAAGLLRSGVAEAGQLTLTDCDTTRGEQLSVEIGVTFTDDNVSAVRGATVVIVCVKPKDLNGLLHQLVGGNALSHRPTIISIAAGVRIATIEQTIGRDTPVIRAMPNTASVIGRGMTVLSAGTSATKGDVILAQEMFSTLGRCLVLDERHLDVVTALSASGPAFMYVMLDALSDGGVRCGLPRHVALELAAQMTLGAAEMVLVTGQHPATLKDAVTTPGGCTIAGLLALEDGRIRSVLARAIETTTTVASGLGQ